MFLINSITTSAGVRAAGAPSGTKWDKNLFSFVIKAHMIILSHRDSPIGNTIEICEFIVNIVGIIEIRLKIRIRIKIGVRKEAVVFLLESVFNSVKIILVIFLKIWFGLEFWIIIGENMARVGRSQAEDIM